MTKPKKNTEFFNTRTKGSARRCQKPLKKPSAQTRALKSTPNIKPAERSGEEGKKKKRRKVRVRSEGGARRGKKRQRQSRAALLPPKLRSSGTIRGPNPKRPHTGRKKCYKNDTRTEKPWQDQGVRRKKIKIAAKEEAAVKETFQRMTWSIGTEIRKRRSIQIALAGWTNLRASRSGGCRN